ncbi:hypothetical protein CYMTET_31729, partial [Cymbomonas tetramitiformis]
MSSHEQGGGKSAPPQYDEQYLAQKFDQVLSKLKPQRSPNAGARSAEGSQTDRGQGSRKSSVHAGSKDAESAFDRLFSDSQQRDTRLHHLQKQSEDSFKFDCEQSRVLPKSAEIAGLRFNAAGDSKGGVDPTLYAVLLYEEGQQREKLKKQRSKKQLEAQMSEEMSRASFTPELTEMAMGMPRPQKLEDRVHQMQEEKERKISALRESLNAENSKELKFAPAINKDFHSSKQPLFGNHDFLARQRILESARQFRTAMRAAEVLEEERGPGTPTICDSSKVIKREQPVHERLFNLAAPKENSPIRQLAWESSGDYGGGGNHIVKKADAAPSLVAMELYQDAMVRDVRLKRMMEERVATDDLTSVRKIKQQSVRACVRRLEKDLYQAVHDIGGDLSARGLLSRQQVLKTLQQMKLFKPAQEYNQKQKRTGGAPEGAHTLREDREEARLLDRLFELLAINTRDQQADGEQTEMPGMDVETLFNFLAAVTELSLADPSVTHEVALSYTAAASSSEADQEMMPEDGMSADGMLDLVNIPGDDARKVHALALEFRKLTSSRPVTAVAAGYLLLCPSLLRGCHGKLRLSSFAQPRECQAAQRCMEECSQPRECQAAQ